MGNAYNDNFLPRSKAVYFLTCAWLIFFWLTVSHAQTPTRKKLVAARVVSGGILVDWNGRFTLQTEQGGLGSVAPIFGCDSPGVSLKEKEVGCELRVLNDIPLLIGSDGNLESWHIEVRGDASFQCASPIVAFSERRVICPQQSGTIQLSDVRIMA